MFLLFSIFSNLALASEYHILFTGDLHFGHNYQVQREESGRTNINKEFGYEHPLAYLNQFLEKADYVVANLESPVTDLDRSSFESTKTYLHKEPVQEITEFFSSNKIQAVSLANNHFVDYGPMGMEDSFTFFESQSVSFFGAGRNRAEAQAPHIIGFDLGSQRFELAILGSFEYRKSYDTQYASYAGKENAGVHRLSLGNLKSQVEKFKKKSPNGKVILFPHWGRNYEWASTRQKEFAENAMPLGTDLIVGHGAHMLQEIEVINQKISFYSLGNFVFNSPGRYNKNKVKAFSQVLFLSFYASEDSVRIELKLYPIFCNNRKNNYQPRPLNEKEFTKEYLPLMEAYSSPVLKDLAKVEQDELGYYLRFTLDEEWNVAAN